jgi:hypothetical protein
MDAGEAIVEAIEVNFVYKVEGTDDDWEEVNVVPFVNEIILNSFQPVCVVKKMNQAHPTLLILEYLRLYSDLF